MTIMDTRACPWPWTNPSQMDASQQSRLLADKRESEFNHHLAGFFAVLWYSDDEGKIPILRLALSNRTGAKANVNHDKHSNESPREGCQ
jgi:hypothetical protein